MPVFSFIIAHCRGSVVIMYSDLLFKSSLYHHSVAYSHLQLAGSGLGHWMIQAIARSLPETHQATKLENENECFSSLQNKIYMETVSASLMTLQWISNQHILFLNER